MNAVAQAVSGRVEQSSRDLSIKPIIERVKNTLKIWNGRLAYRNQLAMCDARLLEDMGISVEQARREANKPFWKR